MKIPHPIILFIIDNPFYHFIMKPPVVYNFCFDDLTAVEKKFHSLLMFSTIGKGVLHNLNGRKVNLLSPLEYYA